MVFVGGLKVSSFVIPCGGLEVNKGEKHMVNIFLTGIRWLYIGIAAWLAVYGLNMLLMSLLFAIRQKRKNSQPFLQPPEQASWPVVTVQLPIYNEQNVAGRLIEAVTGLDYPSSCLQIQVLDDSTDNTVEIVDNTAGDWRQRGRWIDVVRRKDRKDFKAGALRAGLEAAAGEFIAIFDADFVPPPDWLKRAMTPFLQPGNEQVGLVQTRWSHLNEDYSLLTRAQALALDGHFGVEQTIRYSTGLMLNFNGTAGIWRKECIETSGNWRGETLSEDLDLSYRAQLTGWKIIYLPDVSAPAEIPAQMAGFKRQQFRWAKGSIQVARLLGPEVARAPIRPWRKIQGLLHLTAYLGHPLMLLLVLLLLPLSIGKHPLLEQMPVRWLGIAGLGAPTLYALSQGSLYSGKRRYSGFLRFPLLAMLGVGVAVNNTRAVLEALCGVRSPFERTPKIGIVKKGSGRQSGWQKGGVERIHIGAGTWVELLLTLYALGIVVVTSQQGNWVGAAFALLYMLGFAWVGAATVWEARLIFNPLTKNQ